MRGEAPHSKKETLILGGLCWMPSKWPVRAHIMHNKTAQLVMLKVSLHILIVERAKLFHKYFSELVSLFLYRVVLTNMVYRKKNFFIDLKSECSFLMVWRCKDWRKLSTDQLKSFFVDLTERSVRSTKKLFSWSVESFLQSLHRQTIKKLHSDFKSMKKFFFR